MFYVKVHPCAYQVPILLQSFVQLEPQHVIQNELASNFILYEDSFIESSCLVIERSNVSVSCFSVPRIGLNQAAPLPRSCTVTAGGRTSTTITSSQGKTGARPKSSTGFSPSTPAAQPKPSSKTLQLHHMLLFYLEWKHFERNVYVVTLKYED